MVSLFPVLFGSDSHPSGGVSGELVAAAPDWGRGHPAVYAQGSVP